MGAVSIGRARAAERPGPAAAAARPRAREEAIAAAGVPGGRLAEAVRRLAEGAAPEQVWLFGSYARGDFGPDSDIDLLAVVPEMPPGALREAPLAARAALWGIGMPVDLIVETPSRFRERSRSLAAVERAVKDEGVLVYG